MTADPKNNEVENAIDEVLKNISSDNEEFSRKFKHRILLALEEDCPEDAISDLIEFTPVQKSKE